MYDTKWSERDSCVITVMYTCIYMLMKGFHTENLFTLQVRVVCSADAKPKELFGAGNMSQKDFDDNRSLMDDLGIQEVSRKYGYFTFNLDFVRWDLAETYQSVIYTIYQIKCCILMVRYEGTSYNIEVGLSVFHVCQQCLVVQIVIGWITSKFDIRFLVRYHLTNSEVNVNLKHEAES